MDLHTGRTLWTELISDTPIYSTLQHDTTCDVLIVGGGCGGALCAWTLAEHGLDVIVVDKSRIGQGSTRGNIGLLQYMNDTPLFQMMKTYGAEEAVRFYKVCQEALPRLKDLTRELRKNVEFNERSSLYFASNLKDAALIDNEYQALRTHGFPVDKLCKNEIQERFGFSKEAALISHGDAEVNPYLLTIALLQEGQGKGIRVFEHTELIAIESSTNKTLARTNDGFHITSRHIIFATGYETQEKNPLPGTRIGCTYTIATERVKDLSCWPDRMLIWETARPYLYLRTTADQRILVGGMDRNVPDGPKRDHDLRQKSEQLRNELARLFPLYENVKVEYYWASSFGTTRDGIPFIGQHPTLSNAFYVLGYGGNGTVYYTFAAEVIASLILRGTHPDEHILSPTRLKWQYALMRQVNRFLLKSPSGG